LSDGLVVGCPAGVVGFGGDLGLFFGGGCGGCGGGVGVCGCGGGFYNGCGGVVEFVIVIVIVVVGYWFTNNG